MKRKILSVFSLIFALICTLAVFAGCNKNPTEQIKPEPGPETGEYYYAATGMDYFLNLFDGDQFTLTIASEELAGTYAADGEALTLTAESGTVLFATYHNDVVSLTYGEDTYRFLRKINYTVTFDTDGGTAIAAVQVINGKTVEKPVDPEKGELVFVGWYTDRAFHNLFSFTQPITADLTLYARFVENINPEFTVNFDVNYEGGEVLPAQETIGHKLFNLPTPAAREGYTFVGWWLSHYDSSAKLTAQYAEQLIEEPVTLYAVWSSEAPAVSVSESGIVWTGRSGNNSYTVSIIAPDGAVLVDNFSLPDTNYAFDFTEQVEGDYTVSVSVNGGQTTTAYYKNRGLARVTVFDVQESTLLFNSVSNATNYLLTVDCGSDDHEHVDFDLGNTTSFDFSECGMKADGITFTVKATANGYVTSVSEPYTFRRTLDAVSEISVDDKDVVSWKAVDRATSYFVEVLLNGHELYSKNVGSALSIDLQYENSGEVTVRVTPVAFGWASPAAKEFKYTKAHLATPVDISLVESTVTWAEVPGATGYEVSLDGTTYPAASNSFELTEDLYDASKSSYAFTVRALGATDANASLWAPVFTIRNGELGEIWYAAGKVAWDAVFGVDTFLVRLNDGEEMQVVGENSLAITLLQRGESTIYVCAVNKDGSKSEWKSVEVYAYEIKLDAQNGVLETEVVYRAKGDPLNLPEATRYGYTFNGWYTEPSENENARPFDTPTFEDEYDRTVYANWKANEYTISFDVGTYGSGAIEKVRVTFGERLELPVASTDDVTYAFGGWYLNNTRYTDFQGIGGDYLTASDLTLTASWVPIFTFTSVSNGYSVSKGQGIGYVTEVTIPVMYNNRVVSTVQDFTNCTTLVTINIPDSVSNIVLASDGAAFQNCNALRNINIYSSGFPVEAVYYSVDGVLFYNNAAADGGRFELKYYPYARPETEYTIPGIIRYGEGETEYFNVTAIPSGAFRAMSTYSTGASVLQTLNIPATVSLIEENAFFNFVSLTSVNFLSVQGDESEANNLDIRANAFGDTTTAAARITYINLPKRLSSNPREAFANLTYLGYIDVEQGGMFSSVDGLLTRRNETYGLELVYYPRNRQLGEDGKAVIPTGASTSNRATEFIVPEGIYAIGESAVKNNTSLTRIVIPGGVRYIGVSAFEGTTSLKELIFLGEKEDRDLEIDNRAFLGERWGASTTIPEGYTTGLSTLTLPANLTKLGQYAFGRLSGASASAANALHEVYVEVDREEVDFAAGAFLPTTNNYVYITTLHFGAGVPDLEILDIFGNNVNKVYVDDNNPNYYLDPKTGILFNADMTVLKLFPGDFEGSFTIPDAMTNIPTGMFQGRKGLTEIIIHENVTRIGTLAFDNCTGLTAVTFSKEAGPELNIEAEAFSGCTALTQIDLPDRLKTIGDRAFYNCKSLVEFTIPKSVETLGTYTLYASSLAIFNGCDLLTDINVAEGNTHYVSVDGILYTARAARLTPEGKVEYVPDSLLYCPTGKTGEITISGYIRSATALSIGRYSTQNVPQLTKIIFQDAIQTYDAETGDPLSTAINFDTYSNTSNSLTYSPFYRLTTVTEIRLPTGLVSIPRQLFYTNTSLTTLNVPNTVESIAAGAFYSVSKLTTITFDEGGTVQLRIEDGEASTPSGSSGGGATSYSSAFGNLSGLTSLKFPARLSYIGSYAFHYSSGGTSSVTSYHSIAEVTFAEESLYGLELGAYAFYYTTNLKSIKLPEGLKAIPNNAFNYSGLQSIELPEGLESIGSYAFNTPTGTSRLSGVLYIPASVKSIGASAFASTYITKVIFAEDNKLESIGTNAFASCGSLESVVFGNSDTPLTFGNSVFTGTAITSFEFPKNVQVIGETIFSGLTKLTSVTFAEGESMLQSIGAQAFTKTGITEITFPESSAAGGIQLGASLFKSCTAFTTMNLSASISSIEGVLAGCASIKTITIDKNNQYLEADPDQPIIYDKVNGERGAIKLVYGELTGKFEIAGGTSIGASAFANQTELEYVYIPASVQTIGEKAFENCINLKQVILAPDSVLTSIGVAAFHNCWSLESISLENASHLNSFGDAYASVSAPTNGQAFGVFENAGIKSEKPLEITFPASDIHLGVAMFRNSGVVKVDLFNTTNLRGQTSIATSAVEYSKGLSSYLFAGCTKLTTVNLPENLEFLGTYTFNGCTSLTSCNVPEGEEAYFNLAGLKNLTKLSTDPTKDPTASSYYDNRLFTNCSSLTKIVFPDSLVFTGGRSFEGCDNLKDIVFPEGVTYSPYVFAGSGIESVEITGTPVNYMFMGCLSLTSVTFNANVTNFTATYLFQNCASLKSVDMSGVTGMTALPNGGTTGGLFSGTAITSIGVGPDSDADLKLPTSLTHLGKGTFMNCLALEKVDVSGLSLTRFSAAAGTNVSSGTTGASYLFDGCTALYEVKLPETGFIQIGAYTFRNCTSLTEFNLAGITLIGQYAFAGSGLTSVTIPASTTAIYAAAFSDCLDLTDIVFEDGSGTVALTAGSLTYSSGAMSTPGVFARSGVKNVTFGNRVTTLTIATFAYCLDLEEITLPATLTGTMGTSVFYGCENLRTVDMSAMTIAALGNYMFINCYSLETVKLGPNMNYLGTYTFRYCTSLEEIDIRNTKLDRFSTSASANVTTSAVNLFEGCVNLKRVIMNEGQIKQVGPGTFKDCESLESFDFSGIERLGTGTTNTGGAFQNAGLKGTISLPASLNYLNVASGLSAFSGCGNIEKFEVESGCTVVFSQEGALILADGTLLTLPGGATLESDVLDLNDDKFANVTLSGYLFANITNIKKVILPDGMTAIPNYLFDGSGVEEIVVPASVTSVGTNAFANTYNLKKVTFLEAAEGVDEVALTFAAGATSATAVTGVFYGSAIEEVVLPNRLTALPSGTFKDTTALKTVVIPEGITEIAQYTFYNSAIPSLQIPSTVTNLAQYAYAYSGIKELKAEDFKNVTSMSNYIFQYSKVVTAVLPGTINTMGHNLFSYCPDLVSVVFEDTVGLEERAIQANQEFKECYNLESVYFGEGFTYVTTSCFINCTSLTSVSLPASLTNIGSSAFEGCTSLKSIVVGENVSGITASAFKGWTSAQTIYFTQSMYNMSSLFGIDWMNDIEANMVFNYNPEA